MWKTYKVIMLPTKEKTNMWITWKDILAYTVNPCALEGAQHLYIISDEEIKKDDWFHYEEGDLIMQCTEDNYFFNPELIDNYTNVSKVIATTDSSLKIIIPRHNDFDSEYDLPQIPQQFIEEYISEYNKGNVLKDVEVEYWNNCNYMNGDCVMTPQTKPCIECEYWHPILKISKDNFISLKRKEKKVYTREEVEQLLWVCFTKDEPKRSISFIDNVLLPEFRNWIKENM